MSLKRRNRRPASLSSTMEPRRPQVPDVVSAAADAALGAEDPGERHTRLRAIFERDFDYVWNALRRLGVHARDREDLAQEVFVHVYRRLGDYDASRPSRPWLFAFVF